MRVYITGIGLVSPLGGAGEFEASLFAGASGLSPGPRLQGRAKGLAPYNGEGRLYAMLWQAAAEALQHADLAGLDRDRLGVFASASKGGMEVFGASAPDAGAWLFRLLSDSPGARLRDRLGWQGSGGNYPLACATGAYSIGEAYEAIRDGRLDAALAGACEASLTPLMQAGFEGLGALSRAASPGELRGAFDLDRDGFAMGEGAALLLLESEEALKRTGSKPLAGFLAWSANCDAVHITAPDPNGAQAARAMRETLFKAGLAPRDLGYVNAHGTGTALGDLAEARALCETLPESARISGIKAATGHLLGASGALEAAATVMALRRREAPPQLGVRRPMPEMEKRLVLGRAESLGGAAALSLSMGFGGHNVALAFKEAS